MIIPATDDQYWKNLGQEFHLDKTAINFRANGSSPIPKAILNLVTTHLHDIQSIPSVKNPAAQAADKQMLRASIAATINADIKEIAIMRNTTEALNNVLMGFPFEKNDEVIAGCHEYDSMMGSLYQRKKRDGITVKTIDIPYKPASKDEIIEAFEKNITEKTRMFLISHMVWISGQVYPVKEICELARRHNIATVIDAAQSFSHIPIDVAAIKCDYLGSSLHKWCTAPLGTGFLYVRKEMIAKTYPLIGTYQYMPDDEAIGKFEDTGTITPLFQAANASIAFWEKTGLQNKMQRMQWLKEYAVEKLSHIPGVTIAVNTDKNNSCGILYFELKGKSANAARQQLWDKYSITVQAIENYKNIYVDYKGINTIGIATPVFISPGDIDKLAEAIRTI